MFLSLIQNILPATCLALLCIYAVIGSKKAPGILLLILLALATVCFTLDSAVFFAGANVALRIASLAIAILFAPVCWCLFESSRKPDSNFSLFKILGIVAPIVIFVICIIVVFQSPSLGFSYNSNSSNSIVRLIIECFIFAEFIFILFYIIRDLVNKDVIGKVIYSLFIAASTLAILRILPVTGVTLYICLNILLTAVLIAIVSLCLKIDYSAKIDSVATPVTIEEPSVEDNSSTESESNDLEEHEIEQAQKDAAEAALKEAQEQAEDLAEGEVVAPLSEAAENTLRTKFESYLIDGQKFLIPGITMGDVAKDLSTNRTYISQLVNQTYGMTFPEFLNNLRIDYAEQFILHNRNAGQQEIAKACGFPSASSFNVTFKKITGVTPRIWLVTYSEKNQQS